MKGDFMEYNTNLIVCHVTYIDDETYKEGKEYCLCSADSYADCADELTNYYGKDNIISLEMTAIQDGPFPITKKMAKYFISGDYDNTGNLSQ